MTRRAQLILLLRSRADFAFDGVRDSLASLKVKRGPAPSRRIECPDCHGNMVVRKRGIEWGCVRCGGVDAPVMDGRARIVTNMGRGWIEVDAYTERPVSTAEAPQPAPTRVVPCDACQPNGDVEGRHPNRRGSGVVPLRNGQGWQRCRVCEGTGMVSVDAGFRPNGSGPAVERTGDPVLDAVARRERYSFPELDRALTDLAFTHPGWRALVWQVYEDGRDEGSLTLAQRSCLGDALSFLERAMPEEIKVPGYARAAEERRANRGKGKALNGHQRSKRDEQIRARRRAGEGPATLCIAFGLSRRRVQEILAEGNGDTVAA